MALSHQRTCHRKLRQSLPEIACLIVAGGMTALPAFAVDNSAGTNVTAMVAEPAKEQVWNWHVQNTDILDWHPGFPARYSGPNSLYNGSEVQETVSLDLLAGVRLWRGAEVHVDGLMWQGFGFSKTLGAEAFPNGEAFRVGTKVPNVTFSRAF